jgi:uncharacterized protein (UPF0264 family)
MAGLLVSVRSAEEAEAACAGGADLIDVKEPARGSLGRADPATVRAVIEVVAKRRPVSAALGELRTSPEPFSVEEIGFGKWGLSQLAESPDWRARLDEAATGLRCITPRCCPVAVAYADWWLAGSPRPAEIAEFASSRRWSAFLLDTWTKDGRSLLDFVAKREVAELCHICRRAGVRVALAGSLDATGIACLRELEADWIAVRTAACVDGRRQQPICPQRVRQLAELLAS